MEINVEGKESNFVLKWGWLFQKEKEEKYRMKSERKKKKVLKFKKKKTSEKNFMCGQDG